MTDDIMTPLMLSEESSDAELLRQMIGWRKRGEWHERLKDRKLGMLTTVSEAMPMYPAPA